mgnify:CR=1 FL=1
MDIATIVGLILGIGLIGGSMLFTSLNYGLSMQAFWNLESMMIVLGGTLSATAIAFRLNDVKSVFGLIKFVFQKPTAEHQKQPYNRTKQKYNKVQIRLK